MIRQTLLGLLCPCLLVPTVIHLAVGTAWAQSERSDSSSIIRQIRSTSERLDMTVNTSRILNSDGKIPQFQVNNPDILELTALSPNQIQVFAKNPGVTQINLWDEKNQIYTVDVIVYGDARELTMILQEEFPNASIQVKPLSDGVLISGRVEQPEHVSSIKAIAEQFYPNVLTNMKVGGVHQVLLHVKVMEVSRTKLRALGFDFTQLTAAGSGIVASTVSGLVTGVPGFVAGRGAGETFSFQIVDGGGAFMGVLEALRENHLMKVLAEPTLVTVSGRPAFFQVGGEFPILVPQSLGTVSIEYKKFGTQVDFVPIVLGNGKIRLEVRPRVSEVDNTRSVTVPGGTDPVPGLRVREVDTGVELMAGQTLAIAGLVQSRIEAHRRGLPWVSEVPYVGTLFGRVEEENNEIELLIMVTPELVEAMDADEVPQRGPGMQTASPNDWELYMRRHIEVPNCCPPGPQTGMPEETVATDQPGMILAVPEQVDTPKSSQSSAKLARPSATPSASWTGRNNPVRAAGPPKQHNASSRQIPSKTSATGTKDDLPGFIGPIGYDAVK